MLLTVEDLESDSKISRHTWRTWIRLGRIPVVRIGRCVRVDEQAYRTFLADHSGSPDMAEVPMSEKRHPATELKAE